MAQINCQQLSFAYPNMPCLLQNISFTAQAGEWVTIIGASGSGKSTLLRLCKPELAPHGERSGTITVNDINTTDMTTEMSAKTIGFVQQNPETQIVTDRVWHELAFGLENLGVAQEEIRKRVAEIAHYFGIHRWFHDDTMHLSGGQKQLLNVASVLAMQPTMLLLDEPTAQLDPIAAKSFLQTLKQLQQELGLTIVIVEHRLEEVFPLTDRLLVLEEGQLLYEGAPRQFAHTVQAQSPLFEALPIATRIALHEEEVPFTIHEGKRWVREHISQRTPFPEEQPVRRPVLLEAKELAFRYSSGSDWIVKHFNCTILDGEILAIVGSNGSGKSTAIQCMTNLLHVQRGEVLLQGKPLKKYKEAQLYTEMFGILPQNPRVLFTQKTVEQELFLHVTDAQKERITQYIERFGIAHCMARHPYDCSGGEQQKIALIKILRHQPRLLFLDEPTKGLDPHMKQQLVQVLKELQQEGHTIVIVSHELEFCADVSDRCSMFFDGQLLATQPPRAFFASNRFYTTAAHRLTYPHIENAVTYKDVKSRC